MVILLTLSRRIFEFASIFIDASPRGPAPSHGYEDSAEARAERAEAEVAALKDKVAELRERNGKLEGKVEVFERLFSIVEARPKQ